MTSDGDRRRPVAPAPQPETQSDGDAFAESTASQERSHESTSSDGPETFDGEALQRYG